MLKRLCHHSLSVMFLIFGLITTSCAKQQEMMISKQNWQQVKVVYLDFEGGFYGLVTDMGTKLLPMNLDKKFKVEGSILNIKGGEITDMASIQQWGTPFQISDVKLITLGEHKIPNSY